MPLIRKITKAQWDNYSPEIQGYVLYIQGALPDSELKDLKCPYLLGSKEAKEFAAGEFNAMLDTQDGEE